MSKLAELELDGSPALAELKKLSDGIEHMEDKVKSFAMTFAGFGIAFEVFEKVAEGFEGIMQYGARLEALHNATGASIHDLVIFGHALDITGGSAESAENFIFKLQNATAGLNEDGKSTAQALKLLGTNAAELRNMPLLEQVEKISQGLAKIPEQANKAAVIKDLFGFRFAAQAMPLLGNPEAMEKAKQQAGGMAEIMERDAEKFHELEQAIKGAQLNFKTFFAGALEGVAPEATNVAEAFGKIDFVELGRGAGQILDTFVKLAEALTHLLPLLDYVAKGLNKVLDHPTLAGAAQGALLGSIIGPEGTLVGGLLGAAGGFLFGGHDKEHKGFAEDFKGLGASTAKHDSISSLQRVGLGGGFGGGGDPLLKEAQHHTALLEKIAHNTGGKKESGIPGLPEGPPV